MNNSNILISIATFKEAENIVNLISKIREKYSTTKNLNNKRFFQMIIPKN